MTVQGVDDLTDEQMAQIVADELRSLMLLELRTGLASRHKLQQLLLYPAALKADLHKCIAILGENLPGEPRKPRSSSKK